MNEILIKVKYTQSPYLQKFVDRIGQMIDALKENKNEEVLQALLTITDIWEKNQIYVTNFVTWVRELVKNALRNLENERLGSDLLKNSDIIEFIEERVGKVGVDQEIPEPIKAYKELNKVRHGRQNIS